VCGGAIITHGSQMAKYHRACRKEGRKMARNRYGNDTQMRAVYGIKKLPENTKPELATTLQTN